MMGRAETSQAGRCNQDAVPGRVMGFGEEAPESSPWSLVWEKARVLISPPRCRGNDLLETPPHPGISEPPSSWRPSQEPPVFCRSSQPWGVRRLHLLTGEWFPGTSPAPLPSGGRTGRTQSLPPQARLGRLGFRESRMELESRSAPGEARIQVHWGAGRPGLRSTGGRQDETEAAPRHLPCRCHTHRNLSGWWWRGGELLFFQVRSCPQAGLQDPS